MVMFQFSTFFLPEGIVSVKMLVGMIMTRVGTQWNAWINSWDLKKQPKVLDQPRSLVLYQNHIKPIKKP